MALTSGTRIGPYEVLSAIGAGGMGEVYRARDSRLRRDVALKVLPELLAADPERLARFDREAQLLASLTHRNIATIHGVEEANGVRALVLELIEGPTLEERIRQAPVPLEETLRIAGQLVDALETAHATGIVHRDLKPSNIKLRPDGTVKVLDFGLAKALEPVLATTPNATSPTITSAATRVGTILGTAAYMSPEQARGSSVDKRADIWAFGCVVYEMLSGTRAFAGATPSESLARVLMKDPEWTALPEATSPSVLRMLRRSLEKDPKRRLADIADARLELEDALTDPVAQTAGRPVKRRERLVWFATLAGVALLAVTSILWMRRAAPAASEMRVDIASPPTADAAALAISPDGQKIVFVATTEGRSRLWLRKLDSASAHPLAGTDNGRLPFWSPDSRSVAFGAEAQLKRIDLDGGSVRAVANAPVFLGGTWGRDGDILFTPFANGPLFRVPASGGEAVAATQVQTGHGHHSPHFLPDGRHFLFYLTGDQQLRGIHVAELGRAGSRRLVEADTGAVYTPGSILFVRQNTLFAQHVELSGPQLTGEPVELARNLVQIAFANALFPAMSASVAGPIVYRTGPIERPEFELAWIDRSGKETGKVAGRLSLALNPALSADDERAVVFIDGDIWMMDTRGRRPLTRFTFDKAVDFSALWSPDGTRLVTSSNRKGPYDLYLKASTGAGTEELLLETPHNKDATDWSPDGQFLLYRSFHPRNAYDIWALPLKERAPFPVVQTDADERNAQFSPDRRWIAYQSNESGRFEIWIQPFSPPGTARTGRWQVSSTGGSHVRWARNGRELFYVATDGMLMAVPIRVTSDGEAIEPLPAQPLFPLRGIDYGRHGTVLPPYAVSKDGQRFLVASAPVQTSTVPLTVILNWRSRP